MTIDADPARPQTPRRPVRDRVLAALAEHADADGNANVTIDQLAATAGVHRRTVQHHLRALLATGDLLESVYHRWPGRPCTYRLAPRRDA